MEWSEPGFVLAVRRHGESDAVIELFVRERGRHLGLVHGGAGRRYSAMLQPGNEVAAVWRARLPEHLGTLKLEPVRARAAALLDDPVRLEGLAALCALLATALPERDGHPLLFEAFRRVLDAIEASDEWAARLVAFELALLQEMGFGLALDSCALTGARQGLAFVSPISGRAVTAEAARPWAERLLPLPAFLVDPARPASAEDVIAGFALTGHFLERHALPQGRTLPAARGRLIERLQVGLNQL